MTTSPKTRPDPIREHRRRVRRSIVLPFILGIILFALGLAVTLIPLSRQDVSIVSDLVLSCLCLFPLVICLFPLYMVMVLAVYGMARTDKAVTTQLRRVRTASETLAARVDSTTDTINQKTVDVSVRLAPLNAIFGIFERPDTQNGKNEADDNE